MNLKKLLGLAVIFAAGGLAHSAWGQGQADVTDRYVKNADYSQGKSDWTFTTSGGGWSDPKESNPVVFEAYAGWGQIDMKKFSMNQMVTLPAGDYCLQVNAFYRYGLKYNTDATRSDAVFYVRIGEKEQSNPIKTLGSESVGSYADNPGQASSAFNAGLYSNRMDFTVDTEGQVEIGVQGTHALKQSWFILGPVTLLRYMYTLDDYIKEYTYWYGEATKLMNDKMDKDVLTALQTKAVESTTLTTTDACASAIQELRDAVANAKRSSQEYAALKSKIDAAENVDLTALSSLDANAVSDYEKDLTAVKDAYDNGTLTAAAVTKIESPANYMKVKDYNYVTTNYSYAVNLGEWKTVGPTGSKSDQHWSGETHPYLEQSESAWGQNSWNITYSQDITLPAGKYVFKVAGRKSAGNGCNLTLTVSDNGNNSAELGTVSDFPESNVGLGINKNGVTSFDPNDAAGFANNGAGRGFQWRYVEFALEKETSVNIAVSANATALHQWVSFCDATVQTDNEANISMIAYNIALRDAKATIDDTKYAVITGAERTELQAAIEATPGETAEEINFATQTLNEKAATFVAVLAAYNDIATAIDECDVFVKGELPYASKEKYAAIATVKESADSKDKSNAIRQAYRSYIESNALAEGVDNAEVIEVPDANMEVTYDATNHTFGAWQIYGQVNGTIHLYDWESFTDASGKSNYKYADISKDDNNAGIKQAINLAPGKYLMTVTARAAATDGAKFEVIAGDTKASISRIGNTGGAFGKGWNDTSVEFVINEAKDIEIGVKSDNGKNIWWSATRFRLVKIADVATVDVNIAAGKYATRIFPFVPELPAGVVAYTCDDINENNEVVLTEVTTPEANTPYILINTTEEDITDKTLSGVNVATKASYTVGLLTGVYAADGNVPVSTDEEKNYVLQEQNGKQAFYLVDQDGLKFTPYRAYLTVPASTVAGGEVKALFFGDDNATVINGVENTAGATVVGCYNAAGVKLNAPVKGVNILKMSDGSVKKVFVK